MAKGLNLEMDMQSGSASNTRVPLAARPPPVRSIRCALTPNLGWPFLRQHSDASNGESQAG